MHLNSAVAAALLAGGAQAHGFHGNPHGFVGQDHIPGAAAAKPSTPTVSYTVPANLPTFTPSTVKAPFVEQFTDGWASRWKASHAKKDTKGSEEEWAYVGEWAVEEPYIYNGQVGNKNLVAKNAAAHHAISAKFPKKIDPKDKTLVVQYEVKLQKGLECGGAYMKLLRDTKELHQEEFSNASPYVIMFGPDKCGNTNKVHFIFNHKNPKTGEYEEKHLSAPPQADVDKVSHLYTLVVQPNNTFTIQKDGDTVREGSLLEQFSPAVNPEKEIDDPKDSKPESWVDEARIPDPEAKKPEDWDEDAPFEIIDEEATKPEDWLEDEATTVPDPEAQKPEDWDDEEDGDWVAPIVPNPKCADISGCGPWAKPMIKNPDYKGPWTAPYIDNPAYKGVWAPRKIANPDYFEDKTPANFEPMGAIGFELWTMQADVSFDNIYIGHSVEDAKKLADETFFVKYPVEKALEQAEKPKESAKPKSPSDLKFFDDPVTYVKEKLDLFLTIAAKDPVEAIKFVPEVPTAIGGLLITIIALTGILGSGGAPAAVQKAAADAKDKAKDAKDKATEAVSSGAEKAKGEANKRATKGSS
ncbi:putative calreticulin family protein [Rosellinia necatrix]|uniref:Putative calreticulin family protein n=1 Tax=Rosellinia necatrix TaxID=77044 RepID=A0A1W2TPY5_ROSNE|nr:putative calreticulin family protein [Rosellinia necatrix]